jgi:hypothetical protein
MTASRALTRVNRTWRKFPYQPHPYWTTASSALSYYYAAGPDRLFDAEIPDPL